MSQLDRCDPWVGLVSHDLINLNAVNTTNAAFTPMDSITMSEPRLVYFRRLSYATSVVCCLLSASFTVFSLYTDVFESQLGYTPLQINYVSIAGEIGLYLCVPLIGWTADVYKLSYIGVVGSASYVIGYGGCAWVANTGRSWQWMALFFGIIGVGCSASYISSVVNCARLFPNSALLAISIPTTLYGCSSLLYAKLIGVYLQTGTASVSQLSSLYWTLAIVLFFTGILATYAPIWGQVDKNTNVTEDLTVGSTEGPDYIKRFFSDKRTLIFLASFVLISGPLEAYQNNLGLLVKADNHGHNVASQVSLFTSFSTISRLAVGALTDILHYKPTTLLVLVVGLLALADLTYALSSHYALHSDNALFSFPLSLLSSLSGILYGSSFTLFPLTISQVWGIEVFATYWGMFVLGPALGSIIFGVVFALNAGSTSYAPTFGVCANALLTSGLIIGWFARQ